jgi:hypothetical protein
MRRDRVECLDQTGGRLAGGVAGGQGDRNRLLRDTFADPDNPGPVPGTDDRVDLSMPWLAADVHVCGPIGHRGSLGLWACRS